MPLSSTRRMVSTKLGSLNIEVTGEGPAIFCWPSLYCDARTLDPLTEDLASRYRVVVVDGPGHGGSAACTRSFSLDDAADAAMEVFDALHIEQATWIGAAWGGLVGIAAARNHSARLSGLVILNAPFGPWRGTKRALMKLTYALLWLFGPRSFVAELVAGKMIARSARKRDELVAAVAAALRRCDRQGLLVAARSAMFERGDLVPLLGEVRVPSLFFSGADDSLLSVEEARRQAAAIPDCRLVVVENSSHQSALEAPSQVLPIVHEVLTAWSRPVRRSVARA